MATPNKNTTSTVKKYYRSAFVKKIAQCRLKNMSRGLTTIEVALSTFYSIPEYYLDDFY